jgi:hypothetical protein
LVVFAGILGASSARGDEFRLVPSFAVREEYNSNIFVTQDDPERDFVTTLSPGVEIIKRNERLDSSFLIRLDSINYAENRDLDATDQTYKGRIGYHLTPEFSFIAAAGYLIDSSPDRDLETTGLVASALKRKRASASLSTDYQLTEITALSVSYAGAKDSYERQNDDFASHDVNAGIVHDFSKYLPALKGLLNFGYSQYDIGGFRSESMLGTIGVARSINEIWGFSVRGGARYTQAEFPVLILQSVAPGLLQLVEETQSDDGWGWVGQASLTYTGEKGGSDLTFSRDVQPASGQNTAVERNSLAITLRYRFTQELSFLLNAGYFTNVSGRISSAANAVDTKTIRINPRLRYEFTRDVALDATYSYYNVEDRIAGKRADVHRFALLLSIQHALLE